MNAKSFTLCWLSAGVFLSANAFAKPAKHPHAAPKSPSKSVPKPAPAAAPTPAVILVQQYLDARANEQEDTAYKLLSAETQSQFPADQREQMAKSLTDPTALKQMPTSVLPVIALFADIHNTLHFKFRALGSSPDDPAIVLVRAYQVGTPASTVKTLQIVTIPDPAIPNVLLIDGVKTATLAAPEMMLARDKAQQAVSLSNLKQIALCIILYAKDHNEVLPDADQWIDQIRPYVKTESVFRDPAAPDQKWSYAFNSNLSGVTISEIENPATTVLLFESDADKKNASGEGDTVPTPGRHSKGTDYAFADGHPKWLDDTTKPSYSLHGN
jgi:prepilin-type processing-associated H-X9-DG protein